MSSKHNHMVRSHRSEHLKATAFGGFKPAVSPNRNKYAKDGGLVAGLTALFSRWNRMALRRAARKKEANKNDKES